MPAVVVNRRSANIIVKAISGVFTPAPGTNITLNNQGASAGAAGRLDGLSDVVEISPQNGDTLQYNSADDKYYVQALQLDGGTF
ncbi:hypothetical protein UFOVP247_125 [uncultured Caudovirales phage]|uniref:Uncharacterized protein n=1 Tax=uncultured Caudovirales phage TaxID=2100421 RepID=A0A6J7WTI7_9CAUD|nr:hypothetical protein UFOVP247_125 [uncultured Caudovirales phage]